MFYNVINSCGEKMKKVICWISVFLIILFYPMSVMARIVCNDGTISKSCDDCHQGCCSHHGGCSNSSSSSSSGSTNNNSSSSSSSENQKPTITEKPKSSDNTLKKITIDDEEIPILSNMDYSTIKESVKILAVANDTKAQINYLSNPKLTIGENLIKIKVTAENGNVKEYSLNITREKILSNNKNIKIMVDGKEVLFNAYKSDIFNIPNDKNELDIDYALEDDTATAEIIGNKDLKEGYNEIIIRVKAENGEEQDYSIFVNRAFLPKTEIIEEEEKSEITNTEENPNILSFLASTSLIGGTSYFIYKKVKK